MPVSDNEILRTSQDIGRLLFRRLTGKLTEAEHIQLDQWIIRQDPVSRQFFEECTDHDQVYAALEVMYSFDQEAALKDLQKRLGLNAVPMMPTMTYSRPAWRWYRYLIAASIILVVSGIGLFFMLHQQKTTITLEPIATRFKNDVAPGGEKATLKLSDGSTIALDNAANGELAKQGNTKVVKLDNGQLAYHSGRSATGEMLYNTISTPKGGQYQVVLPDGSKIWLNAASSIRFPTAFVGNERMVELTKGEAYFDVTKNASMPFRVKTIQASGEPLLIDVLGTEFNVMSYQDEEAQKATLVSGSVKVSSGAQTLVLKPGEQARVGDGSSNSLKLIADINVEAAIAWKNGRFQFQDASIESIMRQAARWYDVEVVYEGKVSQHLNGTVRRETNLSTMLRILEATGLVHFKIEGKKVTVLP